MSKDTYILAIETSCDETSASIVKNGRHVISNIISSQIETHVKYGGVVPEIASRKHIENIDIVVKSAMNDMEYADIDAIAVTSGPGLVGALLVGVSYAKALAYSTGKPLIPVHHIEGHLCANYLETDFDPPYIVLIASGGHTHLVEVLDYGIYNVLGRTHDDAAGEAFDKVARVLGLGYPGGPKIDKLAREGNPLAIPFPRALKSDDNYNFSFSGLKSAVLNYLNKAEMTRQSTNKADVAASFQQAVTDILIHKTINAAISTGHKKVALAGGVASNSALRSEMTTACNANNFSLQIPAPIYCTDNAAMIASAGYHKYLSSEFADLSLNAYPNAMLV